MKLLANFFKLLTMPNWIIHQYHLEFAPNIESSRIRSDLVRDQRDRFGGSYIFDGMSDLKSPTRLEQRVGGGGIRFLATLIFHPTCPIWNFHKVHKQQLSLPVAMLSSGDGAVLPASVGRSTDPHHCEARRGVGPRPPRASAHF